MGDVAMQQVDVSSYTVKQGLIQLISYLYFNALRDMDAVARHGGFLKVPGNGMSRWRRAVSALGCLDGLGPTQRIEIQLSGR